MMWILWEILADLLLTAFVTGTVNADQKETKRVKQTDLKEGKKIV
jgi:hypothetical protein